MARITVTIIAVSLVLLLSGVHATHAITLNPAPVYQITCTGVNQTNGSAQVTWTRDTTGNNTENLHYLVTDGDGTIIFQFDDIRAVGSTAGMTGFSFNPAPNYNPIRLQLTSPGGNDFLTEVYVDVTGSCNGLPTFAAPAAAPVVVQPGCAVLMPITSTSVVGSFVADAQVYWQPGDVTSPLITIPAGKTAWVLGQDSSEHYYKIVWECKLLWVEKSSMGPNMDMVWNGTPLPSGVVQ